MDLNLDILRMARALASHSGERQTVIAENVANADTPGYKARDLTSFSEAYSDLTPADFIMKATRERHLGAPEGELRHRAFETELNGAESPNGNTVSLEDQMLRGVEVRQAHDLALGVYSKSLDILRLGLRRS